MDAQRVSRLNEIGMVRLLSLLGNSLAAVCVLATVVGGCSPPSATARRDGITSGSPSADRSDSAAPRFAARAARTPRSTARPRLSDRRPLDLLSNSVPRRLAKSLGRDLRRPVDPPRRHAVAARARHRRAGAPLRVSGRDLARSTATSRATRPPGCSSRATTRSSSSATSTAGTIGIASRRGRWPRP